MLHGRAGEGAGAEKSLAAVEKLLAAAGRVEGLAPFCVDPASGLVSGGIMTLGARGDSYYEYLLKQWILGGKRQDSFLRWGLGADPVSGAYIHSWLAISGGWHGTSPHKYDSLVLCRAHDPLCSRLAGR
jgi:hypothetical protein